MKFLHIWSHQQARTGSPGARGSPRRLPSTRQVFQMDLQDLFGFHFVNFEFTLVNYDLFYSPLNSFHSTFRLSFNSMQPLRSPSPSSSPYGSPSKLSYSSRLTETSSLHSSPNSSTTCLSSLPSSPRSLPSPASADLIPLPRKGSTKCLPSSKCNGSSPRRLARSNLSSSSSALPSSLDSPRKVLFHSSQISSLYFDFGSG